PAHQLIIRAQYLKDLSFESPRAPQTLLVQQQQQPEVNLSVDVKARNLGPETFEVVLTVGAEARQGEEPVFLIEISYGSVVTIQSAPPELVPLLVFVETPRLVFPFARAIIANATRDGGFPPLLVNPIDFAELLRREHEKALKEQRDAALQSPAGTA
ncbi:MAG TPA: protein-export chaperone SecB, partial [Usitatibacter sp.]|nr:protein-export chaperone SecB [Usitatibacter sp.]